MTTKDQAIALLRDPDRSDYLPSYTAHLMDVAAELLGQQTAPDCRTCANLYPVVEIYGGYTNKCDMRCTNGDSYVEAPKVVQWRTV